MTIPNLRFQVEGSTRGSFETIVVKPGMVVRFVTGVEQDSQVGVQRQARWRFGLVWKFCPGDTIGIDFQFLTNGFDVTGIGCYETPRNMVYRAIDPESVMVILNPLLPCYLIPPRETTGRYFGNMIRLLDANTGAQVLLRPQLLWDLIQDKDVALSDPENPDQDQLVFTDTVPSGDPSHLVLKGPSTCFPATARAGSNGSDQFHSPGGDGCDHQRQPEACSRQPEG